MPRLRWSFPWCTAHLGCFHYHVAAELVDQWLKWLCSGQRGEGNNWLSIINDKVLKILILNWNWSKHTVFNELCNRTR